MKIKLFVSDFENFKNADKTSCIMEAKSIFENHFEFILFDYKKFI
jgi:hypothetical protein